MADITIDFTGLNISMPEPFDKTQPERQRENLACVALQVLQILKNNTYTLTFPENSIVSGHLEAILADIRDHIADLKFNGQQVTYTTKDAKITIDFLGKTTTTGG